MSKVLTVPFKANPARRHHFPRQRHRVANSAAYDAALRQRGSLTIWFTDAAIAAWKAEPSTMSSRINRDELTLHHSTAWWDHIKASVTGCDCAVRKKHQADEFEQVMSMVTPFAAESGETIMPARGIGMARGATIAMLVLLLLGGVSAKVGFTGEATIPDHAPPPTATNNDPLQTTRPQGMVELGLLGVRESIEAIPALNLPAGEQALVAEAVRHGRLRLVRLPLFDANPVSDIPGSGSGAATTRSVELSSAGYTVPLVLTRRPVTVMLPIDRAAAVAFRGMDGVRIGALTLTGPVRLSPLSGGQPLNVRVVAQ